MNPNPKKILLVEDENFIADMYSKQLIQAGFDVKVAFDGKSGLSGLETDSFDLLLLDIMLPDINGLEVLRQWRVKNPESGMLVLILTNLGQDAVIKEAFGLGANGYLIKSSLTPADIVIEVNNAFSGKTPQSTIKPA